MGRWPERVSAVVKYSGCTLKTWTCDPAVSLFVAAFGVGRKSKLTDNIHQGVSRWHLHHGLTWERLPMLAA